jgi:hypothetical protein
MEDTKKKNIDWLFWLFISLSAIWTIRVFWLFYQDQYNPYIHSSMPLNEVGDFLAGSFSPLAFFWLAYGYWMQNKELKNQLEEYRANLELTKTGLRITEKSKKHTEEKERNYRQPLFKIEIQEKYNKTNVDKYFIEIYNFGETVVDFQIFDPINLINFQRENVFEANSSLLIAIPRTKKYLNLDDDLLKSKHPPLNIHIAFLDKAGEEGLVEVRTIPNLDGDKTYIQIGHTIRKLNNGD